MIAGCAGQTPEPQIMFKPTPVATPVGCVVDRPKRPQKLLERISDPEWEALAPGARAQAFKVTAGERMNYTEELEAATSACKDAPSR